MHSADEAVHLGAAPSVVPTDRVRGLLSTREILPPVLIVSTLAAAYGWTLAPGLTWANGGSDGGDLISAAATGGVAHPTGYPVYLLLAELFQLIPLGRLAFRTNLLSASCTVGAALLVFLITKRALATAGKLAATLGGLVSALSLGFAPLVWSQAVITEVYAVNLLFLASLLNLLTIQTSRSRFQNGITGLVQGLAVGNQILAAVLIPATLIVVAGKRASPYEAIWKDWRWDASAFRVASLGLLAGLCSYAILPIRAVGHPEVNWGNVSSPQGFGWLVSARLYQPELVQLTSSMLWQHVRDWARLTLDQFGVVGVAIALLGLIVFFRRDPLHCLTLWIALAFSAFAVHYNVTDWRVYLLPAYLAFAVWLGLGVGQSVSLIAAHWPQAGWTMGVVCMLYLSALGVRAWPEADASSDHRAETYGQAVIASAPPRAILFAQGDQTVFTLWYFHYALHERQDLAVIATDLLPFDWYRQNLQRTYSGLEMPTSSQQPWIYAIRESNPGRPACYLYGPESLLNCQ